MAVRNISQARAELSALIEEALKGNEVILAKAGNPVAKIIAYQGAPRPRKPGSLKGAIRISADFDRLPDDIADALGARENRR
jgi:prevent-host-death family protein